MAFSIADREWREGGREGERERERLLMEGGREGGRERARAGGTKARQRGGILNRRSLGLIRLSERTEQNFIRSPNQLYYTLSNIKAY